ncbi:DinB family protein [Sphingobacterium spiritivorum]|uniref:DinB family protein n=1 Tax=Sphingobacterium spiritivorum TaxID=258 RepID=UPI003DA520B8
MIAHTFHYIIQTRKLFLALIDSLTTEELNAIPQGFNNNIIWNFGHIVVSTQSLCYVRTGILADASSIAYNEDYKKDTKPTRHVSKEEIEALKLYAVETISKLEKDYHNGVFSSIQPFSTSTYGTEMSTIEEVLTVTLAHDNLHWGYAMAQRRMIKNK